MPKVKLNPMFSEIYGTIGDIVFRRSKKKGEAIVQKRPDKSKVQWSEAQLAQQHRMKKANAYARAAMADAEARAIYEEMAAQGDKRPDRMAFCDYLRGKDLLSKK
jgi:hypothetical protein